MDTTNTTNRETTMTNAQVASMFALALDPTGNGADRRDASPATTTASTTNAPASKTVKTHVEFYTTEYQINHGAEPRGRGSWCFSEKRHPDVCAKTGVLWSPSMTFGEAKKWAREQIRAMNLSTSIVVLWVQP
jgi:hypothetical protein